MALIKFILLGIPGLMIILIFLAILFKKSLKKMQVKMVEKISLTHDTIIFTFTLPNSKANLGLKVGEHIQIQENINGQIVQRKYTPISGVDRIGSFQLLLKVYEPDQKFPNGGVMSSYLKNFPLHQNITISLPYGRFNYLGKSMTQITTLQNKVIKHKYDTFYMVAGGTGITPIFQIIQYICQHEKVEEMPTMILLFANRSQDDILLENQLRKYGKQNEKLTVHFSVDKSIKENWTELVGFVNEEKISKTAPKQIGNCLFMSCGPPILSNIVQKIWVSKMKIPYNNVFRF